MKAGLNAYEKIKKVHHVAEVNDNDLKVKIQPIIPVLLCFLTIQNHE